MCLKKAEGAKTIIHDFGFFCGCKNSVKTFPLGTNDAKGKKATPVLKILQSKLSGQETVITESWILQAQSQIMLGYLSLPVLVTFL